jgi:hypothetical protein
MTPETITIELTDDAEVNLHVIDNAMETLTEKRKENESEIEGKK